MLFQSNVMCVLLCISCSPPGLVVSCPQVYLPSRCLSTCQNLPHMRAAVANNLFRHTVPKWEQCAAKWCLKTVPLHSLRLQSCSCVTLVLKHLWLLSLHPWDTQIELNAPNEFSFVLRCCDNKRGSSIRKCRTAGAQRTPPAAWRRLKCKTKCQTHTQTHPHTDERRLNICCGCRRSRFTDPICVYLQQSWNSTNQKWGHIQTYSNSTWLCSICMNIQKVSRVLEERKYWCQEQLKGQQISAICRSEQFPNTQTGLLCGFYEKIPDLGCNLKPKDPSFILLMSVR